MFELTKEEFENLKSQNATTRWGGRRTLPFAFTEHGVLMLSSVLISQKSIDVNIQIMRIFTKMRELLLSHKDLILKFEKMERLLTNHDQDIEVIFGYLKKLMEDDLQKFDQSERKRIGFVNK